MPDAQELKCVLLSNLECDMCRHMHSDDHWEVVCIYNETSCKKL